MVALDQNGDGKISRNERTGTLAERFRDVLDRADLDGKGYVTEDDLVRELSRQ
jgi:Ca2+-binding EF-hand superfamily protein